MKALLTGFALLLVASTASAAEGVVGGGWYMGLGGGPSGIHGVCDAAAAVGGDQCDDEGVAWKVFLGRDMSKYWGVELSYADAGEATVASSASALEVLEIHPTVFGAFGKFQIPISKRFGIFAKAGVTYYETEITTNGLAVTKEDGFSTAVGAGVTFLLGRNFGIRAEWENYNDISVYENDVDLTTLSATISW